MGSGNQTRPWDAQSLAALLNTQLQPQGVAVTGAQVGTDMQLRFQGVTVEQQLLLEPYLRQVLQQLRLPLDKVQLQGCTTQGKLIWQAELHLEKPIAAAAPATPAASQPAVKTDRRWLLLMMLLAAIAGGAVAFWQTSQWSTQLAPEPSRLSTDRP